MKLISLHTFVDASQSAYGGVVYVRIEYVTGSWKTVPNRTFSISRNTNFNIHGTVFLWCLIVATPDLLQ